MHTIIQEGLPAVRAAGLGRSAPVARRSPSAPFLPVRFPESRHSGSIQRLPKGFEAAVARTTVTAEVDIFIMAQEQGSIMMPARAARFVAP